jgi:hypothetical protein
MIIYEVNHDVEKEIEKEYTEWLSSHIREMLGFKGFESVDWYTRAADDNERKLHWSIHYHVQSMADLMDYLDTHAQKMRADGANRFGGRYQASRRILSLHRHFD